MKKDHLVFLVIETKIFGKSEKVFLTKMLGNLVSNGISLT